MDKKLYSHGFKPGDKVTYADKPYTVLWEFPNYLRVTDEKGDIHQIASKQLVRKVEGGQELDDYELLETFEKVVITRSRADLDLIAAEYHRLRAEIIRRMGNGRKAD